MPVTRAFALGLLLLTLAFFASAWTAVRLAGDIEAGQVEAARDALREAGLDWTEIGGDGTLVRLSGPAPDEVARFRALSAAAAAVGPGNLRDAMALAPARQAVPAFRLELIRNAGRLTAHGLVPTDTAPSPTHAGTEGVAAMQAQATPSALSGRLQAVAPDADISDLVTASLAPAPGGWNRALHTGIAAAGMVATSHVVVTPGKVTVEGLAADRAEAEAITAALRDATPATVELSIDLRRPRPLLSPFLARFRIDAQGARFEACAAESETGLARMQIAARTAGAESDPGCVEAVGAPDARWSGAVAEAIDALRRLGHGTVTISDLSVTLALTDPLSAEARADAAEALEAALPRLYRVAVMAPPAGADADRSTASPAHFSANLSDDGELALSGALPDTRSLEAVESFAAARIRAGSREVALDRRAGLPEGWSVRVLAGLDALGSLRSGHLSVSPEFLHLRGVAATPEAQAEIARALVATVGAGAAYALDVRYDPGLDALSESEPAAPAQAPQAPKPEREPQAATPQLCLEAVEAELAEGGIVFAAGSVDLAAPALRTVERIAERLRDCPDLRWEVGGHTDSYGAAAMNMHLSQARADAVLNALMEADVDPASLTSRGYGEAEPIADNATASGRETNRRIAFRLIEAEGATGDDTD